MPAAWSKRDERKFQHIKESEIERGRSENKAAEIAARTVNKQRREAGLTPNKTTQGTGNPTTRLETHSKDELYNRAKALSVKGRSSMNKEQLIAAIRKRAG